PLPPQPGAAGDARRTVETEVDVAPVAADRETAAEEATNEAAFLGVAQRFDMTVGHQQRRAGGQAREGGPEETEENGTGQADRGADEVGNGIERFVDLDGEGEWQENAAVRLLGGTLRDESRLAGVCSKLTVEDVRPLAEFPRLRAVDIGNDLN